ncbi:MAG: PDZ domain-containing protein [Planctomycetota bacterium]
MRAAMLVLPWFLAAASAQSQDTPGELVAKLGDKEYAVREQATKDLIALGEKAVPALESALKSDDLEVRLRAGRALRAIQGERNGAAREPAEEGEAPPSAESAERAVQIEMKDGRVKVTVRTVEDGKEKVAEYEGASLEELKEKHPELRDALGGVRFRAARDPFDMEEFWRGWGRDFNEDFLRRWRDDFRRDMERFRRWQRDFQDEPGAPLDGLAPGARRSGALLGVEISRPDAVLDAHLDLKGKGLVVLRVQKGTRAARLGLKDYDVLVELNGVELAKPEDVANALQGRKEGEKLRAVVVRRAQRQQLEAAE